MHRISVMVVGYAPCWRGRRRRRSFQKKMEKLKSSLSRSIQLLKATAESTLTAVESLEAQMSLLVSEEVKGEKEKRKKKERDPNAPKRPGSGFFIFRSENLQKEVNGKKMTSGEVNAKWAALTEDEKASYNRKATKKLEQWKTESASYKASHTAEGGELHEEDDESVSRLRKWEWVSNLPNLHPTTLTSSFSLISHTRMNLIQRRWQNLPPHPLPKSLSLPQWQRPPQSAPPQWTTMTLAAIAIVLAMMIPHPPLFRNQSLLLPSPQYSHSHPR